MNDYRSPQDRDLLHVDDPVGSAAYVAHDRTVLSIHEVAAALGLSQDIVRRAIASGDLAAVRHRADWLVSADEVLRFSRQRNLPTPLAIKERFGSVPHSTDLALALPVPSSALIGRDAEIERLIALLSDPVIRLVTLTGPGGIGKTRLALAVAAAMRHLLTDGAIFIDLSAVARATDVIPAIAKALGLRERVGQDQQRQINDYLRAKNLLLVLDNVEQIIAAAPAIARTAREAAGTTLLVTSRAPLRVGGEREIPVLPLLSPAAMLLRTNYWPQRRGVSLWNGREPGTSRLSSTSSPLR